MRRMLILTLLAVTLTLAVLWWAYARDMRPVHKEVAAGATVVETAFGSVAFESGGVGSPMLAIHGAGGGHDQGRLLAEAFVPVGFHWIAPSRFGYPGSTMPDDASTRAQAEAFADLLDHLDIEQIAVLAMSGGVPPALQFALRYPERTQALILLSLAPYAPLTAAEQELPVPLWLYDALFASDVPLWAMLRLSPHRLAPMFDAREDLADQTTQAEAAFLDAMIKAFLPVTLRRAGLANEGAAINPKSAIDPGQLAVPVLIVHARDDRITPFSTAVFTAGKIPHAQMLALDTGGHLLLGHHAITRAMIQEFLAKHVASPLEHLEP